MTVATTETRPRIRVDESDLRKLRAFGKEHNLDMDEVYGMALEEFAKTVRSAEGGNIAEEIRSRETDE